MLALGYRPHLTLGLFATLEIGTARRALMAVAAGRRPIPISFAGLGLFKGPSAVLFAGPVVTGALLGLHAALQEAIDASPHEHYRVGAWVPHCTLADDLDETSVPGAVRVVTDGRVPFEATGVQLELVAFPPVRIIQEAPMAG